MHSLQIVFGVALMAVACAAVEYAPIVAYHHAEPEHYAPPKYSFEYSVKDEHTGDIKSQHETREGDSVKGYYTLVQPDGKKRIVEYTSEHKDGFNAIVHYEGEAKTYAPAPKYVAAAPVYKYTAPAPVYKYVAPATPVYKYVAPAPVYKYSAPAPVYKYAAPAAPKYAAYTTTSFHTPHFSYKF